MRLLPSESLLYFADTAHVPYGGRPLDEVRGFALSITDYLIRSGAKMVVMACNISSAVALDEARKLYPKTPILGVIVPGVQAAVKQGGRRLGVLATQGTVSSGAYTRAAANLAPNAVVTEVPCPRFVPLIEAGKTETVEALNAARAYLEPLSRASCDTIILGCTHYPFLINALSHEARDLFSADCLPRFVDPAQETVREAAAVLADRSAVAPAGELACHRYFTSADPDAVGDQIEAFLGSRIDGCNHVSLDPARLS